MKKTILMLLLAAMSTGAMAEWVEVIRSTDGNSVYYIDPATIRKDGKFRRVWVIEDLKQRHRDGEMSRRVLQEFDCKDERIRVLSLSEHSESMAGGQVLISTSEPGKWTYGAPGTVGEIFLTLVCGK